MTNKKAKIISVVGAGGKTTLTFKLAGEYAKLGNSVLVTTTTHMLDENFYHSLSKALEKDGIGGRPKKSHIYKIGSSSKDRVGILSKEELDRAKEIFDYIIIEADGSRCMPVKIPKPEREPVILEDSDEVYVVMGMAAIDRKFKVVCQRYDLLTKEDIEDIENKFCKSGESIDDLIVTKPLLEYVAKKFYVDRLSKEFPNAKFNIYLADMKESKNYKSYKKIAFVNLASGSSRRFSASIKEYASEIISKKDSNLYSDKLVKLAGDVFNKLDKGSFVNKLVVPYKKRPIFEHLLLEEVRARDFVIDHFRNEYKHNLKIDIAMVTPYLKIEKLSKKTYKNIKIIFNPKENEGISSSIKKAINYYSDYDALVFFNTDFINLKYDEIGRFVINSIKSNNIRAMMCNEKGDLSVPAFADKKVFKDIKKISGDTGAKEILSKEPCYLYHIEDKALSDIDDIKDILL